MRLKVKTYSLQERIDRTEAVYTALGEAAYEGNMGIMEVAQFYMNADAAEIENFELELEGGNETAAWDIVQKFTGVNLNGIGSDTAPVPQPSLVAQQIDEYFNKKKKVLTQELLYEMVRGVINESGTPFTLGVDDTEPSVVSDGSPILIAKAAVSVASGAEAMEMALVYGILNADTIGGRSVTVDPNWFKTLKKGKKALAKMTAEQFAGGIRIGVKIARAGSVKGAEIFGQSATDVAKEGMNSTPKTDILIEGMSVSVKDFDSGFQAEAIEEDTFRYLFDFALQKFTEDNKGAEGKEYLSSLTTDGVSEVFKGVLSDYRTNPEGHGQEMNNLLGLKGASDDAADTRDEDKEALRKFVSEKTTVDAYNILIDNMTLLFKDPDFKKEFVWQAVTGEYKFEATDAGRAKSIATHMLYFSPSQENFSVRKLMNDDGTPTEYLDEMVKSFTWQIRTGRRKAAPAGSGVRYQGGGFKASQDSVDKKLGTVGDYILNFVEKHSLNSTDDAVTQVKKMIDDMWKARYKKDSGMFMSADSGKTDVDQHGYEFVRALGKWVTSKTYTDAMEKQGERWSTVEELLTHMFDKWEGKETVTKDEDGNLVFKGRSGRFGTDVGAGKGELDNSYVAEDFRLDEGWMGDAWGKIKSLASTSIEKVQSWLGASKSKLLDFLGFQIGKQVIKHPEVNLNNTFEK